MSDSSNHSARYCTVSRVVRERRTFKVLADRDSPPQIPTEISESANRIVADAITDCGMAPFHYDRNWNGVAEPWRFHILLEESCRKIAAGFFDWFEDVKPGNKLPSMLSACGALVLATWIPLTAAKELTAQKLVDVNEEHLAAASAAVQNLLLLLTAAELGTYWSSGGQFRSPAMFEKLGIDPQEKLIAAVFVDYQPANPDTMIQRIPGKNHERRSPAGKWMRTIEPGDIA